MDKEQLNKELNKQIIKENDKADRLNSFRMWQLAASEFIDSWRVVPRLAVVLYGMMMYRLMEWYLNIQTFPKIHCAADVLSTLLSKGIPLDKATEVACRAIEIVGGPTVAQTTFVTAIIGLSAGVFGFYVNSGRDWSKSILPWKFGAAKNDTPSTPPTTSVPPNLPTK